MHSVYHLSLQIPKRNNFVKKIDYLDIPPGLSLIFSPTNPLTYITLKCLTFFDISAMVLPRIHHRFLKLFVATFFKPEKMAKFMESTRQKTFTRLRTLLSVAAILVFILVIYFALHAFGQYIVVQVTDGDTVKVLNFAIASTVRLVGSESDVNYGTKGGILALEIAGISAVMEKWRW
jgi:hypothetical protein